MKSASDRKIAVTQPEMIGPHGSRASQPVALAAETDLRDRLRIVDRRNYPEVDSYSWTEIYGHGDNMAPGGLYLAARMSRSADIEPDDQVLDIGCGKGDSSLFLAKHFRARVVCFDLWTPSWVLGRKIEQQGCRSRILPLDLDATKRLPFADGYFDAMFCMQSLHSFGADVGVLRGLLRHLKPGGRLVVGGTCFDQEPNEPDESDEAGLPELYSRTDGWDAEYRNYHSPGWWRELFLATGLVEVIECSELDDGLVLWEDEVRHHGERAGWTPAWHRKAAWLVEQLIFSREHTPRLTHYVATLERK